MIKDSLTEKIGYRLAQSGAALILVGGIGDLFIRRLLPAHVAFLEMESGQVSPHVEALVMALLHALGASLIAMGLAALVLLYLMRSTGRRWIGYLVILFVLLSEGVNAVQMYRMVSPYYLAPVVFTVLVVLGLIIYLLPRRIPSSERIEKAE